LIRANANCEHSRRCRVRAATVSGEGAHRHIEEFRGVNVCEVPHATLDRLEFWRAASRPMPFRPVPLLYTSKPRQEGDGASGGETASDEWPRNL
jgi:hypothetical protein